MLGRVRAAYYTARARLKGIMQNPCKGHLTNEIRRPFMPLSEKPTITEAQAASLFVMATLTYVRDTWASVVEGLEPIFALTGLDPEVLADSFAPYEFWLAAMPMQMQALNNLIGVSQAQRLRGYVFQCLETQELGRYPTDAIGEYEQAWSDALSSEQAPHAALAAVLAQRLGLDSTIRIGNGLFHDPVFLTALAVEVVKVGALPSWKELTSKYRIVA